MLISTSTTRERLSRNAGVSRRQWLTGFAALALAQPASVVARGVSRGGSAAKIITPEQFGAVGDGRTNDTVAFAKMTAYVNRQGGGIIDLRPTTYIVGQQSRQSKTGYAYWPGSIMDFMGCTATLYIRGNGARLRCADGLRYGTFDPKSGLPTQHTQPFYEKGELASPYFAMIRTENCSGQVVIEDLELDGNLSGLKIGGPWGDNGWQIGCTGLILRNNSGSEQVSRVNSHHHGQDGISVDGLDGRSAASLLADCTSDYNGRQGCSVTGGTNYVFENCRFRHTGKGGLMSAPGAGVDIEAEGKRVRNLAFRACEFSNNAGVGLLADQGNSEGATFESCRFIGTTGWSAWPSKPGFRFNNCEFVGAIANALGHADPDLATQFNDCLFRDDPALSPTGEVYRGDYDLMALLPYAQNVTFNRCRFELTHQGVLPWSSGGTLYQDCLLSQVVAQTAYPRGVYKGTNRISGPVDLWGSQILGDLYVNDQLIARTS